ncbi:MAG: hypothetical protein Q7T87_11605 [Polaromonas sp.]|nr:hypothetical protein [Polaromonas sp.]
MPTHGKPAWVYQDKSIHQVIEELGTFENPDLKVLISIDYGENPAPLYAIKKGDGCCLVLHGREKISGEKENFKAITISGLIKELKSEKEQELELRLSLGFDEHHKPISIIGKKNGLCLLMSCSDYYDQLQALDAKLPNSKTTP